MGEPVELLLLHQARADSEIGDKFKKMLLSVYKSEARSMEEPKKGNFELGSISFLFNQMWDHVRQLQLVSTDATFLATSMLTHNMLADHVSALQLCSQDIDWLCTWVPEFAERLQRIEKDDGMDEMMMEGAEMEEALFAEYISSWERVRRRNNSISFEDSTTLSSMLFTHYMPGHHPLFADLTRTMQIFSIKITELEGFNWPLEVYGVVAARDAVDYRRNTLFVRNRDNCQLLKEEDCFLHLTGPSRAVVSTDTVHIEIQLKVKGTKKSEDRSLITEAFACAGDSADTFITHSIDGCFCKIKLTCEHFRNSIQATIVSIRVTGGSLLPANHVQVVCSSLPEEDTKGKTERKTNYVLFDQKDVAVPVDEYGYLKLSRQVVPVQLKGKLEIVTKTGGMSGSVVFKPELSNISQNHCILGNCKLEMTVAWSFIVDAEQDMLMMSYTKPFMAPSTFPFMKLVEDTEGGSC
uniref:Uncharacterized protein n=1 Tax=Avena sativa TaxID=4498 RepID=A0ACD5V1G5_AVESA